jgi:hypothetical protein
MALRPYALDSGAELEKEETANNSKKAHLLGRLREYS